MAERLKTLVLENRPEALGWFQNTLDGSLFSCQVVGNLEDFKTKFKADSPQIIVLGLPSAGSSNVEAIQSIASLAPQTPIVVMVESASDNEILECIQNGAQGFLRVKTLGSHVVSSVLFQAYEHQKAISSVNEGRRTLQNLISNLPGFVYRCRNDEYWTMEYLSEGFKALTGYDPKQVLHNQAFAYEDLIHPDDRIRIRKEIQKAIRKGDRFKLEYRILTSDKTEKWVWEQGNAPEGFKADGMLEGFITDITEKKYRENQMQLIIGIGDVLNSIMRPADFSRKVLEKLGDLYKTGNSAILLPRENGDRFYIEAATGDWENMAGLEVDTRMSPYVDVFSNNKIYLLDREKDKQALSANDEFLSNAKRFIAFLPLVSQQRKIGLVVICRETEFSIQDREVIQTVAEMISTAIERAILYRKAEKHVKHLESLHAIDQAITAVFDIQVVNKVILDQACRELEADAADILILNAPANMLEFCGARGFIDPMTTQLRIPLTTSTAGRALLENQAVAISSLAENPLSFTRKNMLVENFQSYFARPLSVKGETVGVMEVFFRRPAYPDDEWTNFFNALATQAAVAYDSHRKYTDLQKIQQNMASSLRSTIETWSRTLELHEIETHGHIRRVTNETLQIAKLVGIREEDLPNIERGALLHDIGKLAIMDDILQKKGALTDEEWTEIKRHPEISRELLSNVKLLEDAVDIPYSHHENWDGSGYPQGLKGEEIPLPARIFAVVETYDALISPRPYREAWPKKQAIQYLIEQKGKKFDPKIVDLFVDTRAKNPTQ